MSCHKNDAEDRQAPAIFYKHSVLSSKNASGKPEDSSTPYISSFVIPDISKQPSDRELAIQSYDHRTYMGASEESSSINDPCYKQLNLSNISNNISQKNHRLMNLSQLHIAPSDTSQTKTDDNRH